MKLSSTTIILIVLMFIASQNTATTQPQPSPSQTVSPTAPKDSSQSSFITFTNTFIENGRNQPETVVIPTSLYNKRTKAIFTQTIETRIQIFTRGHTLIEIDLEKLAAGTQLNHRKRSYTGTFYVFIKDSAKTFLLQKKPAPNSAKSPPNAKKTFTAINVIVSKQGGAIIPILPSRSLITNLSKTAYKINNTAKSSKNNSRGSTAYIFPPDEPFKVHFHPKITPLHSSTVTLSAAVNPRSKKQLPNKTKPTVYTYHFNPNHIDLKNNFAPPTQVPKANSASNQTPAHFTPSTNLGIKSIPLPNPTNHLHITLQDVLGNRTELVAIVIIDKEPPAITLYGHEPKYQPNPTRITDHHKAFIDSLDLYATVTDNHAKTVQFFIAQFQLPFVAPNPSLAPSSTTTTQSPKKPPPLPEKIQFTKITDSTKKPLTFQKSTLLYYYSEDAFGNKSPTQSLVLEKNSTLPPSSLIKSK
ncbi:hypothetical protein COTS27_00565 [Spirochaetota bacterium]|nr:hypothetical protein COTS27_00565 [Spirochaetota bacterium]